MRDWKWNNPLTLNYSWDSSRVALSKWCNHLPYLLNQSFLEVQERRLWFRQGKRTRLHWCIETRVRGKLTSLIELWCNFSLMIHTCKLKRRNFHKIIGKFEMFVGVHHIIFSWLVLAVSAGTAPALCAAGNDYAVWVECRVGECECRVGCVVVGRVGLHTVGFLALPREVETGHQAILQVRDPVFLHLMLARKRSVVVYGGF